ncbi:ATP-binding protein [Methylocella silvestris]|uniref:ATP-binding protein n=1 Tax=Methylocella silvestris TaxID=199596 RepID=UPI000312AC82
MLRAPNLSKTLFGCDLGGKGKGMRLRPGEQISFERFRLLPAERLLLKEGSPVAIGSRALDLLIALTHRGGDVVSARELIAQVWPHAVVEEGNLRVQIAALRKSLGDGVDGGRYVMTVAGRGYAFVAPIQRSMHRVTSPFVPSSEQPATNLPPAPIFLVGRKEAIDILTLLLLSRRFVSIVGPGGIGKTTAAVVVAHTVLRDFGEDAVYFVDLGSISEPSLAVSTIASTLGCSVQGANAEANLCAFLIDKRMLIVLDSCEHLIETIAPLAERLFREAPSVYLLATSREALRVQNENVHLLSPLSSPIYETPSAAQALASPAVQLFMERAASSGYRSELSEADAPIVANICRRLDGIALAIELSASRVGTYGIRGTADLLHGGAELFLLGRRSVQPRHQTLHATLEWSFTLLSPDEQRVFRLLSVFVGQFTLEAASSVAGVSDSGPQTVINAVASLADKSLITASSIAGRPYFRLLDVTRSFASLKLRESGEEDAAAQRHACYFAALLDPATIEAATLGDRSPGINPLQVGNIRKALGTSFSGSGEPLIGVRLAARAAPLFFGLSLLDEIQKWCRLATRALDETNRGTLLELDLQGALAMSSMFTGGDNQEISCALERALEIAQAIGHTQHEIHLLLGRYIFLTRLGDIAGALAAVQQSAALVEARGRSNERAMTQWILGAAYHLAGDQPAAVRHCEIGFELRANMTLEPVNFFGYDYNARGLTALVKSLWLCGFPDRSLKLLRQGIDDATAFDHPVSYCVFLLFSTPVLIWSGALTKKQSSPRNVRSGRPPNIPSLPIMRSASGSKANSWSQAEILGPAWRSCAMLWRQWTPPDTT